MEQDIERLAFNTAIAALIELVNAALAAGGFSRDEAQRFARVMAPFAPHFAEEVWEKLGEKGLVSLAPWPAFDPAALKDDRVEVPVQILGKVRSRVTVDADIDDKALEAAALADPTIQELLAGKTIRKVIVVRGRLVNIVAS
ncbi:MAG: class I tRNA ligase family protein [Polyangiales bacterium]